MLSESYNNLTDDVIEIIEAIKEKTINGSRITTNEAIEIMKITLTMQNRTR